MMQVILAKISMGVILVVFYPKKKKAPFWICRELTKIIVL